MGTPAGLLSFLEGTVARTKFAPLWALLLFALLFLLPHVAAQGLFGSISGIVTDSSGAVVPNANVKVTNLDTNVVITVKTNSAGVYSAISLNPGRYKVEAEIQGFKTALVNNITLEVNANPKVDLTLSVGQVN